MVPRSQKILPIFTWRKHTHAHVPTRTHKVTLTHTDADTQKHTQTHTETDTDTDTDTQTHRHTHTQHTHLRTHTHAQTHTQECIWHFASPSQTTVIRTEQVHEVSLWRFFSVTIKAFSLTHSSLVCCPNNTRVLPGHLPPRWRKIKTQLCIVAVSEGHIYISAYMRLSPGKMKNNLNK